MENKYYTPSIDEFHVDFEFEFNGVDCNWNQTGFDKHKILPTKDDYFGLFTLGWVEKIYYKPDDPLENWIRVKYLDKEDIEELGFMQEGQCSFKNKDNWYIEWMDGDTLDIYCVSDCRFKGTIRNKSELKKVMEMVGITLTTPVS